MRRGVGKIPPPLRFARQFFLGFRAIGHGAHGSFQAFGSLVIATVGLERRGERKSVRGIPRLPRSRLQLIQKPRHHSVIAAVGDQLLKNAGARLLLGLFNKGAPKDFRRALVDFQVLHCPDHRCEVVRAPAFLRALVKMLPGVQCIVPAVRLLLSGRQFRQRGRRTAPGQIL